MLFNRGPIETNQTTINVYSAYALWRLLSNRYFIMDEARTVGNFIHDLDFKHIVQSQIQSYQKEVDTLISLLNLYGIPGPTPAIAGSHATGNSQAITDREIAQLLFRFMQGDISLILEAVRGTTTNDNILDKLIKMADKSLRKLSDFIIYLKLKGWVDVPPLYPYIPPKLNEKVATNEIFLLFDHLIFRYNSTQYTKVVAEFAVDPDLKAILKAGVVILERQIKDVETILDRYAITLPPSYSPIIPKPDDTQILEDRFIFNVVFMGIRNASMLHGLTLKEIIVNDRLRKFFLKLTNQELKLFSNMVRYGKVKGWINVIPIYCFGPR